jgi:hypothetical protein
MLLIGAAVVCVVLVVVLSRRREGANQKEWETGVVIPPNRAQRNDASFDSLVAALGALRQLDPAFSFVLFEDFLYALYAEAHTARGAGRLPLLAPYLGPAARDQLGALGQQPVRTVVIGSLRVDRVEISSGDGPTRVTALFEANYAEVGPSGREQAYYAAERWVLSRPKSARSRTPERARTLDCPGCGAPLDRVVGRTCSYCKNTVDSGGFDWLVDSIEVVEREARPPMLTGTVEEVGTDDPTVVAPDVRQRFEALLQRDPQLSWGGFKGRVELIFRSFHEGWTRQEPLLVRPYLSDNLFQTQLYWIEAYKSQGLFNRTDGARIAGVELARVISDAYFDAITVRVYATGLDYTVDKAGNVVGGNNRTERKYTEYWTLIRGVARTGAPRTDAACPSCGAGLEISMAGVCKFCNAKVTAGEFDWVLSRIEQDEVYGLPSQRGRRGPGARPGAPGRGRPGSRSPWPRPPPRSPTRPSAIAPRKWPRSRAASASTASRRRSSSSTPTGSPRACTPTAGSSAGRRGARSRGRGCFLRHTSAVTRQRRPAAEQENASAPTTSGSPPAGARRPRPTPTARVSAAATATTRASRRSGC